jgi:hypothetical protein
MVEGGEGTDCRGGDRAGSSRAGSRDPRRSAVSVAAAIVWPCANGADISAVTVAPEPGAASSPELLAPQEAIEIEFATGARMRIAGALVHASLTRTCQERAAENPAFGGIWPA